MTKTKRFTKTKVQEALKVAAEKAKIKVKHQDLEEKTVTSYKYYVPGGHGEPSWEISISSDTNSILNAIDLNEFIK